MTAIKRLIIQQIDESTLVPDMSTFRHSPIKYLYHNGHHSNADVSTLPPDESNLANHPANHMESRVEFSFDVHDTTTGLKRKHKGTVALSAHSKNLNLWDLLTTTDKRGKSGDEYTATGYRGREHTRAIEDVTHKLLDDFFKTNSAEHNGGRQPMVVSTTWEPNSERVEKVKARHNFDKVKRFANHPNRAGQYKIFERDQLPQPYEKWVNVSHNPDGLKNTIAIQKVGK